MMPSRVMLMIASSLHSTMEASHRSCSLLFRSAASVLPRSIRRRLGEQAHLIDAGYVLWVDAACASELKSCPVVGRNARRVAWIAQRECLIDGTHQDQPCPP